MSTTLSGVQCATTFGEEMRFKWHADNLAFRCQVKKLNFAGLFSVTTSRRRITKSLHYTGAETFVDLIAVGGPDIVIDNINCTGSEGNLTACLFSFEVSDCLGNFTHKVGVRCHEESK